MSTPELHIKDSYFFEVPKMLWPSYRAEREEFPDFWIALDDDYLEWEAGRFKSAASEAGIELPEEATIDAYKHWLHASHSNSGKPFSAYVESLPWYVSKSAPGESGEVDQDWLTGWQQIQSEARDVAAYKSSAPEWSEEKIAGYNKALSGKILIPQPFAELRNLHDAPLSGFAISKFMVVQLVVGLLIAFFFIRLANRMKRSDRPKGRLWNLLESVLVFLRDEVARPAIGKEGDDYVPLLWTIFLFVLGMNLMGMVPWVGAPTSSFSVTLGMAAVTALTGVIMGSKKFGIVGYWLNQIPSMDLHWSMAIIIKPVLWAIEVLGLAIKHLVLGIRLLANMVAGHIVLLGIMTIAFSLQGAVGNSWYVAAPISVLGSTLFSCLELFVAFLQAYIFTFLSALFIGAAIHHH